MIYHDKIFLRLLGRSFFAFLNIGDDDLVTTLSITQRLLTATTTHQNRRKRKQQEQPRGSITLPKVSQGQDPDVSRQPGPTTPINR